MNKTTLIPYSVIAAGLCIQFVLVFQPLSVLLREFIPDDGFYYFAIARNIAEGEGPTFDGENLTNGYHPLWLAMLVPVFAALSDGGTADLAPVRGALVLQVFFAGIFGVTLLMLLRRYTDSVAVHASVLSLWFFNPFYLYEAVNGLETALSLACIALFTLSAVRYDEKKSAHRLAVLGVVGGLMMLARLDNALIFCALLAWLLYAQGRAEGLKRAIVVGIIASLVVAPWLLWNKTQFGMLLTSSSVSSTIVNHELVEQDNGAGLAQQVKASAYMTDRAIRSIAEQTGAPSLLFVFVGVAIGWVLLGRGRDAWRRWRVAPEVVLFLGFLLIIVGNASVRFTMRTWYFIAFNFFLMLFVGWFLGRMREERALSPFLAMSAMLAVACVFYINWDQKLLHRQAQQLDMYAASIWMNANLPEGARIGVFNAGIQGYFSRHTVVNLDGLVNNNASIALRERKLWEYARTADIGYISDFDLYLTYRYRAFLGVDDPFADAELITWIPDSEDGVSIRRVRPN